MLFAYLWNLNLHVLHVLHVLHLLHALEARVLIYSAFRETCPQEQYLMFTGLNALGLSMGAGDSAVMCP